MEFFLFLPYALTYLYPWPSPSYRNGIAPYIIETLTSLPME